MKTPKERLLCGVNILTVVCRYAGVIVLTFTGTSVSFMKDEFDRIVREPIQTVAGPNWVADISEVEESMMMARSLLVQPDFVETFNEGLEGDAEIHAWAYELEKASSYAKELKVAVIRGTKIGPIRETKTSYSPFDDFYGVTPSNASGKQEVREAGKSPEDLNNEALRAWNLAMKESGYAVLNVPSRAALYPYQGVIAGFVGTGVGLLVIGFSPFLCRSLTRRLRKNHPLARS